MSLDFMPAVDASPDPAGASTLLLHRRLFDSSLLRIEGVVARPADDRVAEDRDMEDHGVVLPYRGVFTTHSGRRHAVVASTQHAVMLSARTSYRYSYPGAIGGHCLVLAWSDATLERVAPTAVKRGRFDLPEPASAPVLEPRSLLLRERLRRRLAAPASDPLSIEEDAIGLLAAVLRSVRRAPAERESSRAAVRARNHARVERIKELVASAPSRRWTLDGLAAEAAVSPFHLAHLFKTRVGLSVYEYVLRTRLAGALERVLDSQDDLTSIALDAGFASHSHFTARFRARFGATPLELRRDGLHPRASQALSLSGRSLD